MEKKDKNNQKNRKARIWVFSIGSMAFVLMTVKFIFDEGIEGNIFTIATGAIISLMLIYCLVLELFPALGNKKKNQIKSDYSNKTSEEIEYDMCNKIEKTKSFNHPKYGMINLSVDGVWKYSGSSIMLYSKDTGYELNIHLSRDLRAYDFLLTEDDVKIKIIDEYDKILKENEERLRKYFIEKEYQNAYEWITGASFDTEDSVYYTGNKTKEEFKQTLYDNFKFDCYNVGLGEGYKITSGSLTGYIQEVSVNIDFDIVDGKIDDNSKRIDFHL